MKTKEIIKGEITKIVDYGIFLKLEENYQGLIHISEISNKYIKNLNTLYKVGDIIDVLIIGIDKPRKQVDLSIKKLIKEETYKIPETKMGFKTLKNMLPIWIKKEKNRKPIDNKLYP